ncbi:MAG: RdgB/HAM1 family non-canonical purine NTP pyrophosphatase [Campylobacterales bacterium]|nr:RdgB/HAM1 family non-canonical purine NTP pyrophosphatase [Campylobacterales bacterium]
MKIVIASGNRGKVKEIKGFWKDLDVVPYTDLMDEFEIIEDGDTFKANAIIKAKAIKEKISEEYIVIADDSGISIEELGNEPGIYSARYAGVGASDKDNLEKAITELTKKDLEISKAFYTCAIAIAVKDKIFTVHGWMHGDVITEKRGENGFGYDPIFVPENFTKTLGQLEEDVKKGLSHRTKALDLALKVIKANL